jgi:oligopeptide transport system substrate-binding protein
MTTANLRRLLGALLVSSLVLAGCSDGGGTDVETTEDDAGAATEDEAGAATEDEAGAATEDEAGAPTEDEAAGGEDGAASGERVSTYIGQPESLTPTNNTESEGNAVLSALFTMLIGYDSETNEPVMANAESIETEDNQTYVVTLKEGWTFHDGTPVTAESYVNAWNYAAFGPNAQSTAAFFAPIQGYDELQCGTAPGEDGEEVADCEGSPPTAETLSGLVVDSDTQFTVTLAEPEAFFITRLGYPAYAPLPESFYEDPAAFDRAPVGNGPFMMSGEWEDDVQILTDAFPDYQGDDKPSISGIEFRIYADVNTAITDLVAGNLDIVDLVPAEQFEQVEQSVPNTATSDSSSINYIGFPNYAPPFDDPQLRAALSMAIDREAITEGIFNGLREPAANILAPVIPGYEEEVCENWTYNPERAVELFEEAGGAEALSGGIEFWFNEGAAHDVWVDAVITQWEQVLGIDSSQVTFQQLPFAEYLEIADTQGFTGPFRLGWGMDYPHPQNYLQILLEITAPEGGNNATFWTNEEFSAKIQEALAFSDVEESLPTWQEAAEIACNDAPVAPMFYTSNTYAWNDTVGDVFVNAFGNVEWSQVTQA